MESWPCTRASLPIYCLIAAWNNSNKKVIKCFISYINATYNTLNYHRKWQNNWAYCSYSWYFHSQWENICVHKQNKLSSISILGFFFTEVYIKMLADDLRSNKRRTLFWCSCPGEIQIVVKFRCSAEFLKRNLAFVCERSWMMDSGRIRTGN